MAMTLEAEFADSVASLSAGLTVAGAYQFSANVLPVSGTLLETTRLRITKHMHDYNSCYRADVLAFWASKSTLRSLGLLILAVLFHPEPFAVCLELTDPVSDVKALLIESPHFQLYRGAYCTTPHTLDYAPSLPAQHPWYCEHLPPTDLPCFFLGNRPDTIYSEQDWMARDIVRGFGSATGSVLLAELLLNMSAAESELVQYNLEGDAGIRGVGEMSAEVVFLLPGSPRWPSDF